MTDAEFYRDYETHLREILYGDEIILTRDGKDIVRLLPRIKTQALLRKAADESLKTYLREKTSENGTAFRRST